MTKQETVVITRDFSHPLSVIFKAFSTPEIVQKWLAPDGFSCSEVVQDLRIGGRMHTHFVDADGNSAISEGSYTMIVPNSVIAYKFWVQYGEIKLEDLTTTITFESIEVGTRVTAELQVSQPGFAEGCIIGWNQSLDNLTTLLGASS